MATITDIAKEAGVSAMTVSRVINKRFDKVSKDKAERIQTIIEKHGYVPNSHARSLSSKSTRLIAIIIQGDEDTLQFPYNSKMVSYTSYYIQCKGYSPLFYSVKDYKDINRRLKEWNVEGAVFLGSFDELIRDIREDNHIPLVFTDSYSSIRQITNVGIDDFKGGELAAQHFIDNGHKNIVFVGPDASATNIKGIMYQRLQGFKHALKEASLELPDSHIIDMSSLSLREICLLNPSVTGYFVAADLFAVRMMDELKMLGKRVPEDCSLIGFDNLFFSEFTTPKLTTISQDIHQKAQIATDLLFRNIQTQNLPAENVVLDVQLIKRESVCKIK